LPYVNFGPVLVPPTTSPTAKVIDYLLQAQDTFLVYPPRMPRPSFLYQASAQSDDCRVTVEWYVDVRDTGQLHILALSDPAASGKRFWAAAAPFGWNQILAILRKHFPKHSIAKDLEAPRGQPDRQRIDNKPAEQLLGTWMSLEQAVSDLGRSLGY
jgi:nucleoside-diphosphate-sugar epimerase